MAYLRTSVLLSLGVLLMASLSSRGDTVPSDTLTEALLRERVGLFLQTQEGETLITAVLPLVRVRVAQIRYTARAGKPVRLEWASEPAMCRAERWPRREAIVRRLGRSVIRTPGLVLVWPGFGRVADGVLKV